MVDDVKPEQKSDDKKSIVDAGFRWLLGQEANTVLLFVIIIGFGYGIRYLAPQHLQMIQDGYEKLDARHMEAMKNVTTQHTEEVKALSTSFDKTLDRIERLINDRSREVKSQANPLSVGSSTPPSE